MQTRKKAVLVVLLLLGFIQQGVRWYMSSAGIVAGRTETGIAVAAEPAPVDGLEQEEGAHCPLVHVNTAGMAELQSLPGIGPVLAERIMIARREKPFSEIKDLLRVPGIGEKRLAQMAELVCLYFEQDAETK